ncbi:MAG: hypothetical protein DCC49_12145 [Acidobacteria bacterium]|nr:MAG: hypothetical protein DCC49_12145 [Acidobacteriota bacterium]
MALPLKDNLPTRRIAITTLSLILINLAIWLLWQPTLQDPNQLVELGPPGEAIELSPAEAFLFTNTGIPCELLTGRPLTVGEVRLLESGDGDSCGKSPKIATEGDSLPLVPNKNVYLAGFLTMFFHASFAHIFGNMLFLFILGNNVEDRFGHLRYLAFYLLCGIAATAGHALANPDSVVPTLGASGAVGGVMGAFFVLFPLARIFSVVLLPLPFTAYMPAWIPLVIWFAMQFTPLVGEHVAAWAHIGGFIAGVLLTPLVIMSIRPMRLDPEPPQPVFVNAY